MSESLTELEEIILCWVSMDHESLKTIMRNVSKEYGKNLEMNELHNTLLELHSRQLIESYAFSAQDQSYVVQAPVEQYPQTDIWWYVTSEGMKALENLDSDNGSQ